MTAENESESSEGAEPEKRLDAPYTLSCPEQNVPEQRFTSTSEITDWVNNEIAFWRRYTQGTKSIRAFGSGYNVSVPVDEYDRAWKRVIARGEVNLPALDDLISDARNLGLILSEGSIAAKISGDDSRSNASAALIAIYYSHSLEPAVHQQLRTELDQFWSVFFAHPSIDSALDTLSANNLLEATETSRDRVAELGEQTENLLKKTAKELGDLKDYYTNQAALEEPSKYWNDISEDAKKDETFWLIIFCALVIVPILLLGVFWGTISAALTPIISTSEVFSVSSLVVVSAPLLGYGWVLKHISRNYIHSQQKASDASYRKIMCMTFLALSKQNSASLGQAERALILNALFRPLNSHGDDDGPPSGILDLINRKG